MTDAKRQELDALAGAMHLSRSDLIVQAINRCVVEQTWVPGDRQSTSGNTGSGAAESLVELSNILVALAFAAQEVIDGRSRKRRDEAASIVRDAQEKLALVRKQLGC
jgi:hypothetical protein